VPDFRKESYVKLIISWNVVTNKFVVTSENLLGYHSPTKRHFCNYLSDIQFSFYNIRAFLHIYLPVFIFFSHRETIFYLALIKKMKSDLFSAYNYKDNWSSQVKREARILFRVL